MTLDFGKAKAAAFGKSKLTKCIERGIHLRANIEEPRLWEAIELTCREFPERKGFLVRKGAMVFYPRNTKRRSVGFGSLSGKGEAQQLTPSWTLEVIAQPPDFWFAVAFARLDSGRIDDVKEMERLLNWLESKIREQDPGALIQLVEDPARK